MNNVIFWGELKVNENNFFYKAIRNLYGMNWNQINYCAKLYMLDPFCKIKNLSQEHIYLLNLYFSTQLTNTGRTYFKKYKFNKKLYIRIGAYRGLRAKMLLPTRGQRTHTNAKTLKLLAIKKKLKKLRIHAKKKK